MKQTAPELLICAQNHGVCIRIRGRADCTCSVAFKTLMTSLVSQSYNHFELELSECQSMDSTFLGVLCGVAQRLAAQAHTEGDGRLILFNPNDRITELLRSLGVEQLFRIELGTPAYRESCVPAEIQPSKPSREELGSTSLEAHRVLMALDPRNIPKFKDLTEFLAQDLKGHRNNL